MSNLIYSTVDIPYLTTGRRLYAFKHCLKRARERDEAELVAITEEAMAHDRETVGLERAWARSRTVSKARGASQDLDNRIDGLWGASHTTLTNNVALLSADDPAAQASKQIIKQAFPEGVRPIITLPFEEQLVVNDTLLERLAGDLADAAKSAGISTYVARITALNDAFRDQLDESEKKEISFDKVSAANDRGNLFVRRIVAVVLGTHHQETEAAAEARRALLEPILEQKARVKQARQGRRQPPDVDPETGEEVVADAGDASAESQ
jgi:hypothetical protein